jgi:hypothetical protein
VRASQDKRETPITTSVTIRELLGHLNDNNHVRTLSRTVKVKIGTRIEEAVHDPVKGSTIARDLQSEIAGVDHAHQTERRVEEIVPARAAGEGIDVAVTVTTRSHTVTGSVEAVTEEAKAARAVITVEAKRAKEDAARRSAGTLQMERVRETRVDSHMPARIRKSGTDQLYRVGGSETVIARKEIIAGSLTIWNKRGNK